MSVLNEIECMINSQFPEAIIHVERLDDDIFLMVDRDTYLNEEFKILTLNIKIGVLFTQRVSNIFIVMDKQNRDYKKVILSVPVVYKLYKTEYQAIDPESELSLAA